MKETLKIALGMLLCNIGVPEEKVIRWLRLDGEEPDPMKKLDIRSDQKRLEDLLDIKNYTHSVTMIDFDQTERKWLVMFATKEAMKPWSHLTHWVGYPIVKSVGSIEAQ